MGNAPTSSSSQDDAFTSKLLPTYLVSTLGIEPRPKVLQTFVQTTTPRRHLVPRTGIAPISLRPKRSVLSIILTGLIGTR